MEEHQEQQEDRQPQADPEQAAPADAVAHHLQRGAQPQERGLGAPAGDTELSPCRVPSPAAPPRSPRSSLGLGQRWVLVGLLSTLPHRPLLGFLRCQQLQAELQLPLRGPGGRLGRRTCSLSLLPPSPVTPMSPTYREPLAAVLLHGAGPPAPRPPPAEQVQRGWLQLRGAAPGPGEPGQVLRRGPAQAGAAGRLPQPGELQLQDPCGTARGESSGTTGGFLSPVGASCH